MPDLFTTFASITTVAKSKLFVGVPYLPLDLPCPWFDQMLKESFVAGNRAFPFSMDIIG